VTRYDQMHGRFVVGFSVIDTGVRGVDNVVTQPRRATWVLLISRFATFAGVNGVLVPPPNTPQVFTPPVAPPGTLPPGGGTFTGGQNQFWLIYYGGVAGSGGFLDLNEYSTHPAADPVTAPGAYSADFPTSDCRVALIQGLVDPAVTPTTTLPVCYFPTAVRLGLDNDSVILVSPVIDANRTLINSNTIPGTTGPYQGNRVRVLSKRYLYTGGTLTNGNTLVPPVFVAPLPNTQVYSPGQTFAPPLFGQWDLFRNANTNFPAPSRRYTLGLEFSANTVLPNPSYFLEPMHLRGHALAKYSNYVFGGSTQLIGTRGTVGSAFTLYTQQINYRSDYVVTLDNPLGVARTVLVPDDVRTPNPVPQNTACSTQPCNASPPAPIADFRLYVGDARPHKAIHREGHIYDARNGMDQPFGNNIIVVGGGPIVSTVFYDVVQQIYPGAIPSGVQFTTPGSTPSLVLYTKWQNGHFFAPMFDVPANVIQSGPVSPVNQLPYWDKLFVGTTSPRFSFPNVNTAGNIWPSMFDVREGHDRYDQFVSFRDPFTGRFINPTQVNAEVPDAQTNVWGIRAGASTDPNLGGLWVYGPVSNFRFAGNVGQWFTSGAYYDMSFNDVDPYGTDSVFYADVTVTHPHFIYVQTVRNLGLDQFLSPPPAINNPPHGQTGTKPFFLPEQFVTRKEMAAFIVNAQFDGTGITHYLTNTLGGIVQSSFADVPVGGGNGVSAAQQRAIEIMYRRGYTRGCGLTDDGTLKFCPNDNTTRGQMAVFIIRAKMNNVFPTVFSGCPIPNSGVPTCTNGGDNFGLFLVATPYFPGDTPTSHAYFSYIQKLRELRITNGISPTLYGSDLTPPPNTAVTSLLTRSQMATFIVRGFFF
jgi:hypothetical protein